MPLASLLAEEFIAQFGSAFTPDASGGGGEPLGAPTAPPAAWSWVEHGALGEPKLQDSCGSSWAYAVTDLAEANLRITGQPQYSLSVQELLDCVPNLGCGGGWPDKVGLCQRGGAQGGGQSCA